MAAQAHYIRTIHTSFTAAHPHTSTWANAASRSLTTTASASPANINLGSINSHNQNMYQHHLQQYSTHHYTPQHKKYAQPTGGLVGSASGPNAGAVAVAGGGAGAGGARRRSASIRHAPGTQIKFDPFADEPVLGLGFGSAAAGCHSSPACQRMYTHSAASVSSPCLSPASSAGAAGSYHHQVPYTIQIPPAAPTEIQRYSSRRFGSAAASSRSGSGSGSGSSSGLASPSAQLPPIQPPTSSASATTRLTGSLSGPNISKLVAGILLNRVHAVGKPMRRRAPQCPGTRAYRKSCLSSVVCVEA